MQFHILLGIRGTVSFKVQKKKASHSHSRLKVIIQYDLTFLPRVDCISLILVLKNVFCFMGIILCHMTLSVEDLWTGWRRLISKQSTSIAFILRPKKLNSNLFTCVKVLYYTIIFQRINSVWNLKGNKLSDIA